MTWMLAPAILLLANIVYCIIKIKEDFSRSRPGRGAFGILAALGSLAVLLWLLFLLALSHSSI
jgi:hypothetical protein